MCQVNFISSFYLTMADKLLLSRGPIPVNAELLFDSDNLYMYEDGTGPTVQLVGPHIREIPSRQLII